MGDWAVFLPQEVDRKGMNLSSRDNIYSRFWRHVSKEFIFSLSVKSHCLGARCAAEMLVDSVYMNSDK